MLIREASVKDDDAVWRLLEPVIRAGETYALPQDMERAAALTYWRGAGARVFLAAMDAHTVGTYFLRANYQGGGSHVANCGYVTTAAARGRGVARQMCAHSMAQARALGFEAMQFNFVVASNVHAIRLWQGMGFETVGRLPGVFKHPTMGPTDALVMFRTL